MKDSEGTHLNEKEKTLIAMAAAMGAGCSKCAEGLHKMCAGFSIPEGDIRKAFEMGLNAKAEAVNTMRAAVSELLQKKSASDCGCGKTGDEAKTSHETDRTGKMECLIRLASYAASNSGKDACEEIKEALAKGADSREVKFCLSAARMVREKAVRFFEEFLSKEGGDQNTQEDKQPAQKEDDSKSGLDKSVSGSSCGCN